MVSVRNIALGLCAIALACSAERRSAFEGPKEDGAKKETPELPGHFEETKEAGAPAPACTDTPIKPAGAEATIAAEYAPHYKAFDLGAVPGVPGPLGGCAIDPKDPDRLLIAGESEAATAAIYAIRVKRGDCKHITGFDGTATLVASAPNVDANLVFTAKGLLLYTRWPTVGFGELLPGATSPSREVDLKAIGMGGGGAGGLGFVPPGLEAEGELRAVTWPEGVFHHLSRSPTAISFTSAERSPHSRTSRSRADRAASRTSPQARRGSRSSASSSPSGTSIASRRTPSISAAIRSSRRARSSSRRSRGPGARTSSPSRATSSSSHGERTAAADKTIACTSCRASRLRHHHLTPSNLVVDEVRARVRHSSARIHRGRCPYEQ